MAISSSLVRRFQSAPPALQRGIGLLVLALAYFASGRLGLALPYFGAYITLVWLPTGIAVAALMRGGSRLWPGVYLGAFSVNLAIGSPPLLAAAIAVGNTLAPLATVYWLLQARFHTELDRQRDIFLFCLAAALGMVLSAGNGVFSLYLAGVLPAGEMLGAGWVWWLGDTVGVLLSAPLLLTLSRRNIERIRRHGGEFLIWLLISAAAVWVIFIQSFYSDGKTLPIAFLTLPLFVWPALRFGVTGASLASLAIATTAAWGTATGHGIFYLADMQLGLMLLWAYMAVSVLTGLLITVLTAERERSLVTLQRERDEKQGYFEIASTLIVVIGIDGKVLEINRAGCELLGRCKEDILCQDWFASFLPEHCHEQVRQVLRQLLAGDLESVRQVENAVRDGRGGERIVAWHNAVLRNAQGAVVGVLSSGEDVTERKRYEASLEQSRLTLQAILDAAAESIALIANTGIVLAINDTAAKRLGHCSEEMVGKEIFSFFTPEVAARRMQVATEVLRTGKACSVEDERDGFFFQISYSPVFDENRRVTAMAVVGLDITERKRAEQRTEALLLRSRLLMETATDGIHILDRTGKLVEANDAFCAMLGYAKGEMDGMSIFDWDARPNQEKVRQDFDDLIVSGRAVQFETVHRRKDGAVIDVEINARRAMVQGEPLMYAASRDITARKATERQLAESERRYRQTLDAINEGMWQWDLVSGTMICDARWHEILGFATDELNISYEDFLWRVHPDDEPLVDQYLAQVKASAETVVFEFRFRDSLDAWRWLQCRAKVVAWHGDGTPAWVAGTHADISQRKAAELELQKSKDRLQLLLMSMQDRVLVFDTIGYVTESFSTVAEYSPYLPPELFMGRCYEEVLPADVSALFSNAIAGILTDGQPKTFEYSFLTGDGGERVSLVTLSPLMNDSPYPQGYIAVIRDITAMRRAQREAERLAQKNAQLLESLGEGVYGVDPRGKTTFLNSAAAAMLGFSLEQAATRSAHSLFHHHRQDGSPYRQEDCPISQTLKDGKVRHSEEEWYWHRDGHGFPVAMTATPILEEGRIMGAVVAFQDISERKKSEDDIYKLAFFDPLTRLPNRRLLMDRFAQAFSASERHKSTGALLFIDLDNFKQLNDTVGHEAGDQLLQGVAQRLLDSVRSEDTVARLGGDEFVVLLNSLAEDEAAAQTQAGIVAEKIRNELDRPYPLADGEHCSTPSIGVCLFSGRDVAADELLKRADAAMYQAKAAGRNVVRFWQG